jgi:hypothetical protein
MSGDVLAIVGAPEEDPALLEEIELLRPRRVTLLAPGASADAALPGSRRTPGAATERLARLRAAIERRSGAVVVGLAASREQLRGWRFDRILSASALDSGRRLRVSRPTAAGAAHW